MHVQLGDRIYCSHDPLEVSSCSAGELTLRRCEASEDALEVLERLVEDADSESPAARQSEDSQSPGPRGAHSTYSTSFPALFHFLLYFVSYSISFTTLFHFLLCFV